jgi:ATP-dependent helicase/nuclease subunit B
VNDEEVSFSNALAALREALADLRAWPLVTNDRKPWSAAGGMPHLTAISHAGTTGRRRTFVVGFDADRTSGTGRQDPLLPDVLRRSIGQGRLITSVERRDESAQLLSAALASLRGRVTLSYATSGSLDGREAGPSPFMLHAWRQLKGDTSLSYEELRHELYPPASAVPARDANGALAGIMPIDARDVWLDALSDGALLLDGTAAVRAAFPVLAAGIDAHVVANGDAITAFHGLVPNAGPLLDPTAHPDREISPSSLEQLAKCPLAWFYRYGLSLYPSQDPEYDEAHWLDSLQRGSLLHEVFELFTREYQGRQDELSSDDTRRRMLTLADATVTRWRDEVPPPAETVFEAERAEIYQGAVAFLQMERDRRAAGDRGRWVNIELAFGRGAALGPFTLPDGRTLLTHGRADRVDELPDGSLRIIDYKTGRATAYTKSAKGGAFGGGRQLQPALYRAAVESLSSSMVSSFEYRFPTARGGNEVVTYTSAELASAPSIVASLLDHVSAGAFIPTTSHSDCGYCDYQSVCRASRGSFNTSSPRAEWAAAHAPLLPQYAAMLARRDAGADE